MLTLPERYGFAGPECAGQDVVVGLGDTPTTHTPTHEI